MAPFRIIDTSISHLRSPGNFLEWWKMELSYTYGRREVDGFSDPAMSNATMFMLTYYPPKLALSN